MSPKAMGVHSDLGFSGDALCDGGRSMEQDRVRLGLTGVGVVGGHYEVV